MMSKELFGQLLAGSEVVTLRLLSPYIYEAVIKLACCIDESDALAAMQLY